MYRSRFVLAPLAILVFIVAASSSATASGDTAVGKGRVNAVMAAERKVNITHAPIPELGWPGMTMDFRLAETASLEGIREGSQVTFKLHKAADGVYEIESLSATGE